MIGPVTNTQGSTSQLFDERYESEIVSQSPAEDDIKQPGVNLAEHILSGSHSDAETPCWKPDHIIAKSQPAAPVKFQSYSSFDHFPSSSYTCRISPGDSSDKQLSQSTSGFWFISDYFTSTAASGWFHWEGLQRIRLGSEMSSSDAKTALKELQTFEAVTGSYLSKASIR